MTLTTSSVKEFLASFKFSFKSQLSSIIVHTIVLFFALPFVLAFIFVNTNYPNDVLPEYFMGIFPFFVTPVMIIFTLIHSGSLFKYMHNKRSVDLFHAFPIRRTPLLLGRFAVGIVALLVPIIINLIISYILAIFFGAEFGTVIAEICSYGLNHLLFAISVFSFAMLLAVCSGTTMEMFVSGVLICAAWPLLIVFAYATVNGFLPGFFSELSPTVILAFSPVIAAFWPQATELFTSNYTEGTEYTIWHIVITVFYIASAILVYKKRKSETAENVNSFAPVKTVIRTLTTACAGLCFGILFSEMFRTRVAFWFGVVFGSAVVHIITEALYMHTLKKLLKSAKWYAACILVIVIFINVFSFGFFGWDVKTPELDDIESVSVTFPSRLKNRLEEDIECFAIYFGGEQFYKGTDKKGDTLIEITPKYLSDEEIRDVLSLHYEMNKLNRETIYPYEISPSVNYSQTINFSYKLKDGSTFERYIPFEQISEYEERGGDLSRILSIVSNLASKDDYYYEQNVAYYLEASYFDKITLSGNTSSHDLLITETQAQELLDALIKDTKDIMTAHYGFTYSENEVYLMINLKEPVYINEGDKINLITGYTGYAKYQSNGESFAINENCKNVMAFFEKYQIDLSSLHEQLDMKDNEKVMFDDIVDDFDAEIEFVDVEGMKSISDEY